MPNGGFIVFGDEFQIAFVFFNNVFPKIVTCHDGIQTEEKINQIFIKLTYP